MEAANVYQLLTWITPCWWVTKKPKTCPHDYFCGITFAARLFFLTTVCIQVKINFIYSYLGVFAVLEYIADLIEEIVKYLTGSGSVKNIVVSIQNLVKTAESTFSLKKMVSKVPIVGTYLSTALTSTMELVSNTSTFTKMLSGLLDSFLPSSTSGSTSE